MYENREKEWERWATPGLGYQLTKMYKENNNVLWGARSWQVWWHRNEVTTIPQKLIESCCKLNFHMSQPLDNSVTTQAWLLFWLPTLKHLSGIKLFHLFHSMCKNIYFWACSCAVWRVVLEIATVLLVGK